MTEPTKKTDYTTQGLGRLIGQYQDKPNIRGIVSPWLDQIQAAENALWEIVTLRYLNTAAGTQLDTLGVVVGLGRAGLDDASYVIALKAQILTNRSDGDPVTIEKVLNLCCPLPYILTEYYVATFRITLVGVVTFAVAVAFNILQNAKTGGVRMLLTWDEQANFFGLADYGVSTPQYDTVQGLADGTSSLGGYLSATFDSVQQ